jgi:hypothetical protein
MKRLPPAVAIRVLAGEADGSPGLQGSGVLLALGAVIAPPALSGYSPGRAPIG